MDPRHFLPQWKTSLFSWSHVSKQNVSTIKELYSKLHCTVRLWSEFTVNYIFMLFMIQASCSFLIKLKKKFEDNQKPYWDSNFARRNIRYSLTGNTYILIAHPNMFVVVSFQFIIHEGLRKKTICFLHAFVDKGNIYLIELQNKLLNLCEWHFKER